MFDLSFRGTEEESCESCKEMKQSKFNVTQAWVVHQANCCIHSTVLWGVQLLWTSFLKLFCTVSLFIHVGFYWDATIPFFQIRSNPIQKILSIGQFRSDPSAGFFSHMWILLLPKCKNNKRVRACYRLYDILVRYDSANATRIAADE